MRMFVSVFVVAALAACGQPPAEIPPEVAAAEATEPTVAPGPSAGVDGWEIDMTAYGQIGSQLAAFRATGTDGAEITQETLRGRWTILGLWPADDLPGGEDTFLTALNSAVDQDPELDLLVIHPIAPQTAQWPVAADGGATMAMLAVPVSPGYLLIGPDLTIEGYRGALTATPENGIKSVIQGVAEIRKQIAAPQ